MADIASLYPPSPAGIPKNFARPSLRYRLLVVFVLVTLFLFLLLDVVLLAGSLYLLYWSLFPPAEVMAWLERSLGPTTGFLTFSLFRIGVLLVGGLFFGFLFKGFFRRQDNKLLFLEVAEPEQPELFAFIRAVCRDIGSPMPGRVYLNHEVNAAVTFATSIMNLVVPPRKDLLIGLGLVNALNLTEFKAIVAHEFGHFAQRSLRLSGYVHLVHRVVYNMVYVRDRWDNWLIQGFDLPVLSAFAVPLAAVLEFLRTLLHHLFRGLSIVHLSLLRHMELNADLVAVSVAGSDAPVHALLRSEFYHSALQQAEQDLAVAAEQECFTTDLFFHQERAGRYLRELHKDPSLGRPPALPADTALSVQVFQADAATLAAMWADHPPHHVREQNAKRRYFRSPDDDRSAWVLFHDPAGVRAAVTSRFYEVCLGVTSETPPRDPEAVQAFIDAEHAALTLDPRYHGMYDDRLIELAELDRLVAEAQSAPARTIEELAEARKELYPAEPPLWPAEQRRHREEFDLLDNIVHCPHNSDDFDFRDQRCPAADAPELLDAIQKELELDRSQQASFDRAVFVLHYQLAIGLGRQEELCRRYQFHLDLQTVVRQTWQQRAQLHWVLRFLSTKTELLVQELSELKTMLSGVHQAVAETLSRAGALQLPALTQLPASATLSQFLPAEPAVPELDVAAITIDLAWIGCLSEQVNVVLDKLSRIQIKSLGGILAFQEDVARDSGPSHVLIASCGKSVTPRVQ